MPLKTFFLGSSACELCSSLLLPQNVSQRDTSLILHNTTWKGVIFLILSHAYYYIPNTCTPLWRVQGGRGADRPTPPSCGSYSGLHNSQAEGCIWKDVPDTGNLFKGIYTYSWSVVMSSLSSSMCQCVIILTLSDVHPLILTTYHPNLVTLVFFHLGTSAIYSSVLLLLTFIYSTFCPWHFQSL